MNFSYEQHPWGQEQLRRKIYTSLSMSPFNNGMVRLVFRVPDTRSQYKTGVSSISIAWTLKEAKKCEVQVHTHSSPNCT